MEHTVNVMHDRLARGFIPRRHEFGDHPLAKCLLAPDHLKRPNGKCRELAVVEPFEEWPDRLFAERGELIPVLDPMKAVSAPDPIQKEVEPASHRRLVHRRLPFGSDTTAAADQTGVPRAE
jgi:hypothetical protein